MATFTTIRDFVRILVGDVDTVVTIYSDAVLNSHIRLVLITEDDTSVQESGSTEAFTLPLTNAQIALLVYRTARSLIVNMSDTFSYKTPVLAIMRRGGIRQLLSHIDEKIAEIGGGSIVFSQDTFMEALLDGTTRFINEFSDAI